MARFTTSTCTVMAIGGIVAGCQSAPVQYASGGVHATYEVAATGAGAMRATGGDLYVGAGAAFRAPLHDLNMMQDKIPPVLLRAESHPYELAGINSCNDVLDRVSELDLALGPDVDTPKARKRTRAARGADFAASTALDAAGTAAEHFIPMRGTIKQLTGAQRYENHVRHATLAGTTRRSFLKAIGMEHNCSWPAAPLDFHPPQVADAAAAWTLAPPPATAGTNSPIRLASAQTLAPASRSAISHSTAHLVQTARAAPLQSFRTPEPVSVPIYNRLTIPAAAPTSADASQTWRSPTMQSNVVEVSAPITDAAATTSTGSALAPWNASFASSSPHR